MGFETKSFCAGWCVYIETWHGLTWRHTAMHTKCWKLFIFSYSFTRKFCFDINNVVIRRVKIFVKRRTEITVDYVCVTVFKIFGMGVVGYLFSLLILLPFIFSALYSFSYLLTNKIVFLSWNRKWMPRDSAVMLAGLQTEIIVPASWSISIHFLLREKKRNEQVQTLVGGGFTFFCCCWIFQLSSQKEKKRKEYKKRSTLSVRRQTECLKR